MSAPDSVSVCRVGLGVPTNAVAVVVVVCSRERCLPSVWPLTAESIHRKMGLPVQLLPYPKKRLLNVLSL